MAKQQIKPIQKTPTLSSNIKSSASSKVGNSPLPTYKSPVTVAKAPVKQPSISSTSNSKTTMPAQKPVAKGYSAPTKLSTSNTVAPKGMSSVAPTKSTSQNISSPKGSMISNMPKGSAGNPVQLKGVTINGGKAGSTTKQDSVGIGNQKFAVNDIQKYGKGLPSVDTSNKKTIQQTTAGSGDMASNMNYTINKNKKGI